MGTNEWLGYEDKIEGETRLLNCEVVSATHLASKGLFGGADPYIKLRWYKLSVVPLKWSSVYWNQEELKESEQFQR